MLGVSQETMAGWFVLIQMVLKPVPQHVISFLELGLRLVERGVDADRRDVITVPARVIVEGGRRRRREIVARLDMFIMTVPLAQTPVSLGKNGAIAKLEVIIFSVALNIMIVPPIQEHMRSVPIVGIQVVGETHVKEVCSVVVADMSLAGTLFAQLEMIGRVSVGMDIGMRVVVS